MTILNTKSGDIRIIEPNETLLKEIQELLPFGLYPFDKEFNGYKYGFVIKCEDDELKCLKQQPVEVPEQVAHKMIHFHHLLILDTYLKIKDEIGDSIYYATPYLKNKGEAGFESGIAHFFYPKNFEKICNNSSYDRLFGVGATDIFMKFGKAYQTINKSCGLNIHYIGLDIRTRAQLGALISGFMLYKGNFIYHGSQIREGDPRFELLAKRGIKEVVHVPSAPMEIQKDQLSTAKSQ